ncbi:MAG: hypothetical protein QOD99_1341 [Chthoniobacter sp.]|jgi:hypothetical protein|nr:hypothetical protein [Chthoniobacter sp.]
MTSTKTRAAALSAAFACAFPLLFSSSAFCETAPTDKAQALLQEAKAREAEHQRVAIQTEIERLNQDLTKEQKESEEMQKKLEPMSAATSESAERVAQLVSKKQRVIQSLDVLTLQIEAEKLKAEGLKMLTAAQQKASASLARHIDVTTVRASIEQAKLLPPIAGAPDNADKDDKSAPKGDVTELRKKLAKSEHDAFAARAEARQAMDLAADKLHSAEVADTKAKARADELGFNEAQAAADKKELQEAPKATRVPIAAKRS